MSPFYIIVYKVGVRPVVVVSGRDAEQNGQMVTIVPLTSKLDQRQLATHVLVRHKAIHQTSRALCEQVMTLDRRHLLHRIDTLDGDWFTKLSIQRALAYKCQ